MSPLIIILIVAAVIVLWAIMAYNGLVSGRNRVDEAWSDIDVQLKRRYDLIPNLIETVKGYAEHESGVLTKVTEARAQAISAQGQGIHEQEKAENMLSSALRSVFAVAENYPQLRASENFGKLQSDLTDTEDKIQAARRFYNSNVRDYNTRREQFPTNIIAKAFAFATRELFEIENPQERENVKVSF